ncbi:hypothetical protein EDD90_2655 [Streptomyces sp. Ag109_O5-1]|uniref:hypothetical protein n=1 Tax=Streptomyces sp. Ag109_O5-1 TaxID=1938851 RepID=UPI000FBF6889|nr:hypothetical protein [Streptomyces sp. Ag109_O5-1]RPE39644.1 hypothetical protein EDD90_2655 [Streptomyces sp. Ag109_O5-1]
MAHTASTTADAMEAFRTALRAQTAEPPPATEAPTWLWRLATALHGELPPPDADAWATRLRDLLRTAGAPAGLRAVHVWQTDTVLPLLAEAVDIDTAASADLHRAAARGATADRDTWRAALHPVLLCLHEAAYDRASAYAEGHAGARDYALANGHSAAEADAYGHEYARLSSGANARAFAETHAEALGPALAAAYAADDCPAYADTYPGAQVRAVVRASTARDDGSAAQHLAEGLLTALTAPRR